MIMTLIMNLKNIIMILKKIKAKKKVLRLVLKKIKVEIN